MAVVSRRLDDWIMVYQYFFPKSFAELFDCRGAQKLFRAVQNIWSRQHTFLFYLRPWVKWLPPAGTRCVMEREVKEFTEVFFSVYKRGRWICFLSCLKLLSGFVNFGVWFMKTTWTIFCKGKMKMNYIQLCAILARGSF